MLGVSLAVLIGAGIALLVLIASGKFAMEISQGDSAREALTDSRQLTMALLGAVFGLMFTGFVSLAEITSLIASLLGTSPTAITNIFSIGLGWLSISGILEIGPGLFLGVTFGFLGLTLLATEVRSRA